MCLYIHVPARGSGGTEGNPVSVNQFNLYGKMVYLPFLLVQIVVKVTVVVLERSDPYIHIPGKVDEVADLFVVNE